MTGSVPYALAATLSITAPVWTQPPTQALAVGAGGTAAAKDPRLLWSSTLGATGDDFADWAGFDAQGRQVVVGSTNSALFQTTADAYDRTPNGFSDLFVAVIDPALPVGEQLVYATFLGGRGDDIPASVVLLPNGVLAIAGTSRSPDFPTTPDAFDPTANGLADGFLMCFDHRRSGAAQLVYSTLLGGRADDDVQVLTLADGTFLLSGGTASPDFPVTAQAYDTSHNGWTDCFVARFDRRSTGSLQLVYSTFLGGSGADRVRGLVVDASAVVWMSGETGSPTFPVTAGAFSTVHGGLLDAFLAGIDPSRSGAEQLRYSSFLGGEGDEFGYGLAATPSGMFVLAGTTRSSGFPTTPDAFDASLAGPDDAFVTVLAPDRVGGAQLVYSTLYGGSSNDWALTADADAFGAVIISGGTTSADLPTTPGAFDRSYDGTSESFITRLDIQRPPTRQLDYATYLGASGTDRIARLSMGHGDIAITSGNTRSPDFPRTPNAWSSPSRGGDEAFVTRLVLVPPGIEGFGNSSPGCTGPLPIRVSSVPTVGNADFTIDCANAPAHAPACFGVSAAPLDTPLHYFGLDIWIDLVRTQFAVLAASSDGRGVARTPVPIPDDIELVGITIFSQFFWATQSGPTCPPARLASSAALAVTIQPAARD